MKDKIISFIKGFEDEIAKNVNSFSRDNDYFNYLLGQKDICMEVKSIVGKTDEKDLLNVLNNMYNDLEKDKEGKKLDNTQSNLINGKLNMLSYIIKEVEKF